MINNKKNDKKENKTIFCIIKGKAKPLVKKSWSHIHSHSH